VALSILIIPDKFKGTLTANAAAEAMACGWHKARRGDKIELLPMSDGGDGFGVVMGNLFRAKSQTIRTVDAAHRSCRAKWWWEPKSGTAIVESANVIGLAMLPEGKFHPFELDTSGLGEVLKMAFAKGARRCLVGIGGSATNDGAFGLARALGWKFLNGGGKAIERWTELHTLARIQPPPRRRWFTDLLVAVDVQNPLLGRRGATCVYGPQKGLKQSQLVEAETNLKRLAQVYRKSFAKTVALQRASQNVASIPGAGAAGGLGFGLMAFAGAKLQPGFDLFARYAKLDAQLIAADLVITGEGKIDRSTFMGKGIGEIVRLCRKSQIPCIGIAGAVEKNAREQRGFNWIYSLSEFATSKRAKANPAFWLERLATRVATDYLPAGTKPKA